MNETGSNGNGNANESSESNESTEELHNDERFDQFSVIVGKMRDNDCSQEHVAILQLLIDELAKEDLPNPPCLRKVERSKLKKAVLEVK